MPSLTSQILDYYNGVAPIEPPKPPQVEASAAETESMLRNKEMLRSNLRSGAWMIEFTKVDGTPAIMECTLDPKLLPPSDGSSPNRAFETERILRVYALDRQGWRSFVVPNVTKIYRKPENL